MPTLTMKEKISAAILLFALCLTIILVTAQAGQSERVSANKVENSNQPSSLTSLAPNNQSLDSRTCALKPQKSRTTPPSQATVDPSQLTLGIFRQFGNPSIPVIGQLINPASFSSYTPKESIALAHPTNYGDRFLLDLYGQPAYHPPVVVLHETVGSAGSAINYFRTPHPLDSDQVSYHTLIKRDGEVVYLVPPYKRAFGAGDSVFVGVSGKEAVKTHPNYPPSVNNFAYHISLETPPDGNHNGSRHSGYTMPQYQSLAWIVAKTGVPAPRITAHKVVDRSGQRQDPRSFDNFTFLRLLQAQPMTKEIVIDCQPPSQSELINY